MVLAKKSLGQNFLMHAQTAERIVGASCLSDDAVVLEIGPGTGMLTKALLARTGKVVAIETDGSLIPELTERFSSEIRKETFDLIHGDIREFDTSTLPDPYHVVANIPYYITGEILRLLLTAPHKPQSITLLVQKEVAERIARNGGKGSLLSVSVEVYGKPEYCFTVPKGAFRPAPTIDSAVLAIRHITNPFSTPDAEDTFFSILRAGFAHKRKRLAKNLEDVAPAADVQTVFTSLGLDTNIRPEDMTVPKWVKLVEGLESVKSAAE